MRNRVAEARQKLREAADLLEVQDQLVLLIAYKISQDAGSRDALLEVAIFENLEDKFDVRILECVQA